MLLSEVGDHGEGGIQDEKHELTTALGGGGELPGRHMILPVFGFCLE